MRTGEPAFERVHGAAAFEYFAGRPEEAAIFDRAMATFSTGISSAVARAYDFSELSRVIDIGGGEGALLTQILRANPRLEGAVFDLPRTAGGARSLISENGLADRYTFVAGDFFESVPQGYDAYLLKHVIHDWNDERATAILRRVRAAIGPSGKLLLVEGLFPERVNTSLPSQGATRNDCNMLLATGGRQRSEHEFAELYAAAGFRLTRIVPTEARVSVIEGLPV